MAYMDVSLAMRLTTHVATHLTASLTTHRSHECQDKLASAMQRWCLVGKVGITSQGPQRSVHSRVCACVHECNDCKARIYIPSLSKRREWFVGPSVGPAV